MPDSISFLYRSETERFTPIALQWLGGYFRMLHSVALREFTTDMRILFRNLRGVGKDALMRYEASHVVNGDTKRFRCEEFLRSINGPGDGNHFEIRLHPTDISERNVILSFHEQNNQVPTGCDELIAAISEYCKQSKNKQKVFDQALPCIAILRSINEFLQHWRGRVSLQQFTHHTGEDGELQISAVIAVRNTAAYCFCVDLSIK